MATFQNRILARSPYYITATGSTYINSATLAVYIWSGSSASKPSTATYTIEKDGLTSTSTNIVFEISALIRDYFVHNNDPYSTTPDNWVDALWVETELDVDQTDTNPATVNNLYIAFDGYNYFSEGVNYTSSYEHLTDFPVLRIYQGTSIPATRYAFYISAVGGDGIWKSVTKLDGATVLSTSYTTEIASVNSYDKLKYLRTTSEIDTIELWYSSTKHIDIDVEYICEPKYPPKEIGFIDREGLLQIIFMVKASRESLKVKKDSYKKTLGNIVSNEYTYNSTQHQNQDYNVTAMRSITLNSDWVTEIENDIYQQLLLAEYVWIDEVPVTITSKTLDFKTQLNDKLINYELKFDYSNNLITDV